MLRVDRVDQVLKAAAVAAAGGAEQKIAVSIGQPVQIVLGPVNDLQVVLAFEIGVENADGATGFAMSPLVDGNDAVAGGRQRRQQAFGGPGALARTAVTVAVQDQRILCAFRKRFRFDHGEGDLLAVHARSEIDVLDRACAGFGTGRRIEGIGVATATSAATTAGQQHCGQHGP